jgi:hypothetical protein
METMLGISLHSYLYLKLAKTLSLLSLSFLVNKIGERESGTGSARKWGVGEKVTQTLYTHVSKCKNDTNKK